MVDDGRRHRPPPAATPLPDRSRRPGRLEPGHEHRRSTAARAAGSSPPTASATSTTPPGSASRTPATPIPRVVAAVAGPGREAPPRPAEHRLPRARAAALRAAPDASSRAGPWQAFLSNSGAEAVEAAVKLARVATKRPVDPRLPRRLPRPDGPDDGPHDGQERLPRRLRAAARLRLQHGLPVLLPGARRRPRARRRLHLRLGGAARPDAPHADLPRARGGDHRRAGPRRGRLHRPAARLPAAAPRDHPRSTGSCSSPTRSRPGIGRTGELFAVRHWDVEPDILVFAKGIASGLPLSGILARPELLAAWRPGAHGGTYGGNVVACAAANATLDVIEDEGLVANARERGAQFLAGLRAIQARHPAVGDVRGLGLHGRHRVREARRGRRARPGPRPREAGDRRGARAEADRPVGGRLRQRDPDHPAARHDGRRGRPGARDPRRERRGGGRLTVGAASPSRPARSRSVRPRRALAGRRHAARRRRRAGLLVPVVASARPTRPGTDVTGAGAAEPVTAAAAPGQPSAVRPAGSPRGGGRWCRRTLRRRRRAPRSTSVTRPPASSMMTMRRGHVPAVHPGLEHRLGGALGDERVAPEVAEAALAPAGVEEGVEARHEARLDVLAAGCRR